MLENEELHIVYSGYVFIFRAAHIVEQLKEVTNRYKIDDNSTFFHCSQIKGPISNKQDVF